MCGIIGYKGHRNADKLSNFQKFEDIPLDMNILNFIKLENYYCQINPLFQDFLKKEISNYTRTANKMNTSRQTISRIVNQQNYWMNFQMLLNLTKMLKIKKKEVLNSINSIKTHNSFPLNFNLQNLFSPAFFRVIGHILGDGGIHVIKNEGKYRAFYTNNQQILLNSFSKDITKLFGNIKLYSRTREWQGDEIWLPTTLGYIFYQILDYERLNNVKRIPKFVFSVNDHKLIGALLQAFYDDDGFLYPHKNMIVIAQKNKKLLNDIRQALIKIDIKPNKILIHKSQNRTTMYYFSITSKEKILKFAEKIGFLHPVKKKKLKILVDKYRGN